MKQAAEAQAEQERQAEQKQAYVDLLKEQANLEEEIAKPRRTCGSNRSAWTT